MQEHGKNLFPASYHTLNSLFALSTIVGRRAAIPRDGYILWPPLSILLLGQSGAGKSKSMGQAYDVIKHAGEHLQGFSYERDWTFTMRGTMDRWENLQREEFDNVDDAYLEGAFVANELSSILSTRTGTEIACQWIIEVLEHGDQISDRTGGRGQATVRRPTVAFAFASTLAYLRKSVSIDHFAGGFMHRFLVAHEPRGRDTKLYEGHTDPEVSMQLAADALEIREDAPGTMTIHPAAEGRLSAYQSLSESRYYESGHLGGFWNRFAGIVAKVAGVLALSDRVYEISLDHVTRAHTLVRQHCYPALPELIMQLQVGPKKRELFDLADDIWYAGPEGVQVTFAWRRLDTTSIRRRAEILESMTSEELVFPSQDKQRLFATQAYAAAYDREHPASNIRTLPSPEPNPEADDKSSGGEAPEDYM